MFFQIPSPVRLSLEQRDYIINELVETEKNYLDILETIHRCFMRPLSKHMNPEEVRLVFGSIKVSCVFYIIKYSVFIILIHKIFFLRN